MTVVDWPNYISHFTNLRHLAFANLFLIGWCKWDAEDESPFAWVNRAIVALRSPITHLTIEVLIRQPAELDAVNWKGIDVLTSTRETLPSLVQVSVVFLSGVAYKKWDPKKSIADPVAIRRLMPLTSMKGLLTVSTRGPKM